jgi:hypothetical protein
MRTLGLIGTACAIAAIVLGGCADWSQLEAAQTRAHDLARQLGDQRALAEQRAAQAQQSAPSAPETQELKEIVERLKVQESVAKQGSAELDTLLARAKGQSNDPIGQTIGTLSPLIPDPVKVPLALGAALVLSIGRSAQLKKAALSIAHGMENAMDQDEQFRARFKANAATFNLAQTPTAQRIVDQAQGKILPTLPL